MAGENYQIVATAASPQIVFCDTDGDFSPAANNDLRLASNVTLVQMATAGLTNNAAHQSDKADLGAAHAPAYAVTAAVELASSGLAAGNRLRFYWVPSNSATAGRGNAAGVVGANGSYSGYSSNIDDSLAQAIFIGNMVVTSQATGTVQIAEIGILWPPKRYGTLVIVNQSGASFHTDDVEINISFEPIIIQPAA